MFKKLINLIGLIIVVGLVAMIIIIDEVASFFQYLRYKIPFKKKDLKSP